MYSEKFFKKTPFPIMLLTFYTRRALKSTWTLKGYSRVTQSGLG